MTKKDLELTGIFMKDHNNMVTGFFSQFSEAVSQASSIEDAEKKLFEILPDVLELKDKMSEEDLVGEDVNVTRKSYSLSIGN